MGSKDKRYMFEPGTWCPADEALDTGKKAMPHQIMVRVPDDLYSEIQALATKLGIGVSTAVRYLTREGLHNEKMIDAHCTIMDEDFMNKLAVDDRIEELVKIRARLASQIAAFDSIEADIKAVDVREVDDTEKSE